MTSRPSEGTPPQPPVKARRAATTPFAAAALLAAAFAALLHAQGSAEGGARMVASAALGPIGAVAPYAPPVASLGRLAGIPFRDGAVIDESYRLAFAECDQSDTFRGGSIRPEPKSARRTPKPRAAAHAPGCREEPNAFSAFIRLDGGAVFMQATLGLDLSGSHAACDGAPRADCAPFLDFAHAPGSAYDDLGARWAELFPSSDALPLVSIPLRRGPGSDDAAAARAFAEATGLGLGDLGVVVYRDRIVPVMISDGAPQHRALSGSLALFNAIGVSRCRRGVPDAPELCAEPKEYGLGAPVVAIFFPGSRPDEIRPETLKDRISADAMALFQALATSAR